MPLFYWVLGFRYFTKDVFQQEMKPLLVRDVTASSIFVVSFDSWR